MTHEFVAAFHVNFEFGIVDVAVHVHPRSPSADVDPVPHGTHAPFKLYLPTGHDEHAFATGSST
jgi:hypothetical protein